ncbi:MAG: hypothetical protein WD557_18820 [Dehalococcoidia bacterium]
MSIESHAAPGWVALVFGVLFYTSFNVPALYIARAFKLRLWWLAAVPMLESTILAPIGYRKWGIIIYWGLPLLIAAVLLAFLLTGDLTRQDSGVMVISFPLLWQYFAWAGVCLRVDESRFYAVIACIWPISIFGTWRIAAVTGDQAHGRGLHGVPQQLA